MLYQLENSFIAIDYNNADAFTNKVGTGANFRFMEMVQVMSVEFFKRTVNSS